MAILPYQGLGPALAAAGAVLLNEPHLMLTQAPLGEDPAAITLAALEEIECDFVGYSRVELGAFATGWHQAGVNPDGNALAVSLEAATFRAGPGILGPQSIFGWALLDPTETFPIAYGTLPIPVGVEAEGDGLIGIVSWGLPETVELVYQAL